MELDLTSLALLTLVSLALGFLAGFMKGYIEGKKFIFNTLSADIDLRKVPVMGKVLFEMRVRAPYKNGKRGVLYLVQSTTELVPESQIEKEESDDEK